MGPNSFQWCPVTWQGLTGTNWSRGSSVWTWGRTSSLWGWWSTGTGCPGRLWILLLWRHSRPAWTRSCAACCRWPCFGREVGLDDPQRSLPTPTTLWFCDSVILWKQPVSAGRQAVTQKLVPSTVKFKILFQPEISLLSITSYQLWVIHYGIYTGRCQFQKN